MAGPDWAAVAWQKSRRSGDSGSCVEWARSGDRVGIRDSRHPDGPVIEVTAGAWRAFVFFVKGNLL
jgi:Domain of unknown function (DUF397)